MRNKDSHIDNKYQLQCEIGRLKHDYRYIAYHPISKAKKTRRIAQLQAQLDALIKEAQRHE
jgi:hypothetical protein